MEVGFLVIMVCLAIILATLVHLNKEDRYHHRCGNCRFYEKLYGSKHLGNCCIKTRSYTFTCVNDSDEGCRDWERKPKEHHEYE
jgi:hypothetical protein